MDEKVVFLAKFIRYIFSFFFNASLRESVKFHTFDPDVFNKSLSTWFHIYLLVFTKNKTYKNSFIIKPSCWKAKAAKWGW